MNISRYDSIDIHTVDRLWIFIGSMENVKNYSTDGPTNFFVRCRVRIARAPPHFPRDNGVGYVWQTLPVFYIHNGRIFSLATETDVYIFQARLDCVGSPVQNGFWRGYLVTNSRCYAYGVELALVVEGLYVAERGCNDFDETTG